MSDLKSTAGPALGKIPSGLAIATAQHGKDRTGFLASWFQQISFDPPLVAVCIKAGRPIEALIQASGHFALNLLKEGDHEPLKRYGRGFEPGVDPWAEDAHSLLTHEKAPVFKNGYAYLVLKHTKTLSTGGDHDLFIGEVVEGALQEPDAKPRTHVRKDGFGY